jgi:hypothetical protein
MSKFTVTQEFGASGKSVYIGMTDVGEEITDYHDSYEQALIELLEDLKIKPVGDIQDILEGKCVSELEKELESQLRNGELLCGSICSEIIDRIRVLKNKVCLALAA